MNEHSRRRCCESTKNIDQIIYNNLNQILESFKVETYELNNRVIGKCPIHNGDNPSSLIINTYTGDTYSLRWRCWTKRCDGIFGNNLAGFLRGLLSSRLTGCDGNISYQDAIKWLEGFLGGKKLSDYDLKTSSLNKPTPTKTFNELEGYPRELVRKHLKIPCPYFAQQRNFNPTLLERYDIGFCDSPLQKMYNRTVCPIYDESGERLLAVTGRSIFNKCKLCNHYHNPNSRCPNKPGEFARCVKWRHSINSQLSSKLYNFYNQMDLLESRRRVILVESIANVLRLESAGVKGSVCTFGCKFSHDQANLLNKVRIKNIIVAYDHDEAGQLGAERIVRDFSNFYNIRSVVLTPPGKDIADFDDNYIKGKVIPILKGIKF